MIYHFLLSHEQYLHNLQKRDIAFAESASVWSFWPYWGWKGDRDITFLLIVKKPFMWEQKVIKHEELGIFFAKFWQLEHSSSYKIDRARAPSFPKFKWAGRA